MHGGRSEETQRFYRRDLPHWREPEAIYFVTWRIVRTSPALRLDERTLVAEALRFAAGTDYRLHAFVVMNDHVHLVISPVSNWSLEDIIQSRKSYTSHVIQKRRRRKGKLWLSEYFDRIIRNETEFIEKCAYIWRNPFKRWPELETYDWVWSEHHERKDRSLL